MATHRFLHIGDTHLHADHRQGDRLAALDQIIAYGEQQSDLAAWLWPGDLFHARSTADDRNAIASRLRRMNALAPVVICYGNHDAPGDLDLFAHLAGRWPVIVQPQPHVLRLRIPTGAMASIFILPYPHRAGLVSAGTASADLVSAGQRALDAIFLDGAARLRVAESEGDLTLMIGHVNVGGSLSSVGQPQIGREIELEPALLARLGDIPKALSHIHKHQQIHDAVYAGSITRMDFGEQEDKGFVEWVYDTVIPPDRSSWCWRFVPLITPQQFHVEGTLDREYFEITRVNGAPADQRPEWNGADVRVKYTYKKAEISTLDTAKILVEFAGCRSLKLEGIPVLEAQVRAPEVVAAVTLADKTEAFCRRAGLAWTPSLADKVDQIQADDADRLIRAWTAEPPVTVAAPESAVA